MTLGRSIRRTLLLWYSITLAIVIASFGAILSWRLWRAMTDEVDAELRAHAQAIAGALEPYPDGHCDLEMSEEYVKYFQQPGDDSPYYVIWNRAGEVIDRPDPKLDIPRPSGPGAADRAGRREVAVAGQAGTLVLVGRETHEVRERLRAFLGTVLGAGAFVLALALAGGWLLAGRALAPIARISETASRISGRALSARIPLAETESELGRLAKVLNDAFARLEEAFERQTRFTADASHELRTPLSIVMSHLELALRRERTPEEYREAIGTALRAAERMRAVVEGLLTLARADAGTLAIAKDRVDLRKAAEETVSLLAPMAGERKVALAAALEPTEVIGDRDRLREVITNLVTNAIRYNREGGKVDVRLRREEGSAVLSVVDTGIGIPDADREHLFERFYRVDKVRSREQGGSGLGLSITKWIVEAHGGTIGVESRPGDGTTFTVRLPAAS